MMGARERLPRWALISMSVVGIVVAGLLFVAAVAPNLPTRFGEYVATVVGSKDPWSRLLGDIDLVTTLHVISLLTGFIGIAMVFIPALALRPIGIRLDRTGAFGARLFGAASIGLATALWDGVGMDLDPAAVLGLGNAVFYYCLVQGSVIVWAVIRKVANPWALCLGLLDAAFIAAIRWQGWPG